MSAEIKETVTVRVEEGQLRGRKVESRAGGHFWSFQGVPYARPPLGPLRFKDAQPCPAWEGVRDAFQDGDMCAQIAPDTAECVGDEDCLYLNVYTPRLPGRSPDPLPVMVFIHGGGFEYGSGSTEMQGPDYLLTGDVIVVNINHRLGVLGFMYLEEACPGNVGLKDQVAALRWVQRNIAAFGGDPSNVTLFGMSAGGAAVHMHMLSPMSKGLFQRAIAMSGAALNPWAVQTEPVDTARRLARVLGFKGADSDHHDILRFLRGVDCKELVRAAREEGRPEKDKKRLLSFCFVPTPETIVPGVETFFPDSPEKLMKEGRHHNVPYMTGLAEHEGLLILAFVDFRKQSVAKEIDAAWKENVLSELRLSPEGSKQDEALDELRNFYMQGKSLSKDTEQGYADMFSDLTFHEGIAYALRCMAETGKTPLYQYVFTLDEKLNMLKRWKNIDAKGAVHGDDLGYLFRASFNDPDLPEDSVAAITRKRMVRMWTNFAKTGDPTPDDDPLLAVRWKRYTAKEKNFLEIGAQLRNGTDLFGKRVAFWQTFYDKYGSSE